MQVHQGQNARQVSILGHRAMPHECFTYRVSCFAGDAIVLHSSGTRGLVNV